MTHLDDIVDFFPTACFDARPPALVDFDERNWHFLISEVHHAIPDFDAFFLSLSPPEDTAKLHTGLLGPVVVGSLLLVEVEPTVIDPAFEVRIVESLASTAAASLTGPEHMRLRRLPPEATDFHTPISAVE